MTVAASHSAGKTAVMIDVFNVKFESALAWGFVYWFSAFIWITSASKVATFSHGSTFFSIKVTTCSVGYFTASAMFFLILSKSHWANRVVADARFATTFAGVGSFGHKFPSHAFWVFKLEWTDFSAFFDWAAFVDVIVSKGYRVDFMAFTAVGFFFSPGWAIVSDVSIAYWLEATPSDFAATHIVGFLHESLTFWAGGWVVSAFFSEVDSFNEAGDGAVTSLSDTWFVIVVPDFADSVSGSVCTDATVAVRSIEAFSSNSDEAWFTEATGFVVCDWSGKVDVFVIAGHFFGWSAA